MSFADPHLLWLTLLAPLAAAGAAGLWRRRLAAAAVWAARGLWDRLLSAYSPHRLRASVALFTVAVLGVALALARPRWGLSEEVVERRGVDVVFVLDSSLSMGAADVAPSRLAAAKTVIRRLVQARPQDRVALVGAEGTAEVLSPLTVDGAVVDLLLDTVEPGSLPTPGTDLAAALEAGLGLFVPADTRHRVMVVLSDGEYHGGGLGAITARLAEAGVAVHTLGFGTPEGAPVPIPGAARPELKRDERGKVVVSRLGEEPLASLAEATGAAYLRVTGPAADLDPLLRRLDESGSRSLGSQTVESLDERFQWPLAAAALALAAHLGMGPFRWRRSLPGRVS